MSPSMQSPKDALHKHKENDNQNPKYFLRFYRWMFDREDDMLVFIIDNKESSKKLVISIISADVPCIHGTFFISSFTFDYRNSNAISCPMYLCI